MSTITHGTRIIAKLQCLVMLACLLVGAMGICPDACCHDPHHAERSVSPVVDSESHHYCTMLACSHCSSFIAADAESAELPSSTRCPPPRPPVGPDDPLATELFRPPISLPC